MQAAGCGRLAAALLRAAANASPDVLPRPGVKAANCLVRGAVPDRGRVHGGQNQLDCNGTTIALSMSHRALPPSKKGCQSWCLVAMASSLADGNLRRAHLGLSTGLSTEPPRLAQGSYPNRGTELS